MEQKFSNKKTQIKQTVSTSFRIMKLVWDVERWLFLGTFVSTLIPGIVPFINVYIYKLIIDLVVLSSQQGIVDYPTLFLLLGIRVFTYFAQNLAFTTQDFMQRLLWTKFPIHLNQLIFQKTSSLDAEYFEDSKFRDLLEQIHDSYQYRPQNLVTNLFLSMQSFIQVTIAFVAIAHLSLLLVFLITLVAVPEFISQTYHSKMSWGIWTANTYIRRRFYYLTWLLQEAKAVKEIKIFKLANKFLSQIKEMQEKFYQDNTKIAKTGLSLNIIFGALSAAVFIGIEIFVVLQALAKKLTVGDIGFYTGVVNNFQNGLGGLFRNLSDVFESSLYVKSIFELLDTKPLVEEIESPLKLDLKNPPIIEFKDVSFTYPGTTKKVLKNFSLTIKPGEKIAFVGENGAGKSTIIKLLARIYDVSEGEILIDGVDLKNIKLDSWHKNFGVLFQDFNQYEYSVRENIEFGKTHEPISLNDVIAAATLAGAHSLIEKLDKGYEQMLGRGFEDGIELSGGQWQKIALSRAFLRNAPILVLDEPTASIDAKAEAEIFNKVERLSFNKTIIIISHRFSTVRNAGKIYVIDNGKIIEAGSHKELIKLKGQYATLFNLQAKGYR